LQFAASVPGLLAADFRKCTRKRSTFPENKKAASGGGFNGTL